MTNLQKAVRDLRVVKVVYADLAGEYQRLHADHGYTGPGPCRTCDRLNTLFYVIDKLSADIVRAEQAVVTAALAEVPE